MSKEKAARLEFWLDMACMFVFTFGSVSAFLEMSL